jgi:hypothetical protein
VYLQENLRRTGLDSVDEDAELEDLTCLAMKTSCVCVCRRCFSVCTMQEKLRRTGLDSDEDAELHEANLFGDDDDVRVLTLRFWLYYAGEPASHWPGQ